MDPSWTQVFVMNPCYKTKNWAQTSKDVVLDFAGAPDLWGLMGTASTVTAGARPTLFVSSCSFEQNEGPDSSIRKLALFPIIGDFFE
jgi:hypothetical protein